MINLCCLPISYYTEYLYHKRPWICSVCRNHIYSPFINHHRIENNCITMGVTSWAGTAYPSVTPPRYPLAFVGLVLLSLQFSVLCHSLSFVLFLSLYYRSFFDLRLLITLWCLQTFLKNKHDVYLWTIGIRIKFFIVQ